MTPQTIPGLDAFTEEAIAWLRGVAAPRTESVWGVGSDSVAVFENWTAEQEREHTDEISRYEQAKFDAGWGALSWPPERGGRSLPLSYVLAFRRAEESFDVPRRTGWSVVVLGHAREVDDPALLRGWPRSAW